MSSLSTLGIVHTGISLVAVAAGVVALARHRAIGTGSKSGLVYIGMTVLSCLTSLFIFAHGGFGKPHVLALVTLAVLALAWGAAYRYARLAALLYSFTLFLHMIPAATETLTRLPAAAPLASSPDDPLVAATIGGFFVVFVIGAFLQWRALGGLLPGAPLGGHTRARL